MNSVFLFFGLLFALLRVGLRVAGDHSGSIAVQKYGTFEAYKEKYCDEELEKELLAMFEDQNQYFKCWEMIEQAYEDNKEAILREPERINDIWQQLLKKRRPLGKYTTEWRLAHGFLNIHNGHTMVTSTTQGRALFCMMRLKGKIPKREAWDEYLIMTDPWGKHVDNLRTFDCDEWIERFGTE